ncbi:MaoC family dehydratase N-terminal domain-containing protein [Rhizobacter sp. Root404]|jgi:acyl dehydratase|uniref:MaoC family dehydratase N-terminal domain-containing protein n=1 Tax=Rhizobacter sp. Root404 TaxID=1736528 RepID=UPI0006F28B3F|nr:MaoC family dehydratase N-terminal domain-containing protein [Rhizobacter sp. Root404]KQW37523.1 acyl dehydratase [Rhizobacter sp. Root404]
MIDSKHIGRAFAASRAEVEKGRLRFFAKAIGETDPVYTDEAVARAAGHASLPVPPTFLFSLEMEKPDPFAWMDEIGMDLTRILHGEQSFTYHRMAYAGDTLTFESHVADVYDKKNGALTFVVRAVKVTDQRGAHVADLRSSIAHRNT